MPVLISQSFELPVTDNRSIDPNITSIVALERRCQEILSPFLNRMMTDTLQHEILGVLRRATSDYCLYHRVIISAEDVSIHFEAYSQTIRFRLHPGIITQLQKTTDWQIAAAKRQSKFIACGKSIVKNYGHDVKWGKSLPHTAFDLNGHCQHCELFFSIYQDTQREACEVSVDDSVFAIIHEANVDDYQSTEEMSHMYCSRYKAML